MWKKDGKYLKVYFKFRLLWFSYQFICEWIKSSDEFFVMLTDQKTEHNSMQ